MRNGLKITIIILAIIILMSIACLVYWLGHPGSPGTEPPFPNEGVWESKDLGITLNMDTGSTSFNNGEREIKAYMLREYGSICVSIHCNEFDDPQYPFSYCFFSGDFLHIAGDIFYIKDHQSRVEYVFHRVIE